MAYSVKYKSKGEFFEKILRNVKADGIIIDTTNNVKSVLPYRFFLLEDGSRVEIPMTDTIFKFDAQRFLDVKKQMDSEAGQVIPTK